MFVKKTRTGSGFTLVELLVVILIISVLAAFLVPAVNMGRRRIRRAQCVNNLRSIGQLAMAYADDHKGFFPVKRGVEDPRAYESLNLLVAFFEGAQEPEMYQCPDSSDIPPEFDEDQNPPFELQEENLSYAWRNKALKTGKSARIMLGCDNSIAIEEEGLNENHDDGINYLRADGSVKWYSLKTDLMEENQDYQDGGMAGFLEAQQLGL